MALVAVAFVAASCSTTSSPLVVDALTLTDQANAQSAASNSEFSPGMTLSSANADSADASRQDRLPSPSATQTASLSDGHADSKELSTEKDSNSSLTQPDTVPAGDAKTEIAGGGRINDSAQTAESASGENPPQKKSSFFASLFGSKPTKANLATAYAATDNELVPAKESISAAETESSADAGQAELPGVRTASTERLDALPGVQQQSLFEIDHKNSIEDIDTIDAEERDSSIQLASAAGMARLSPEGFVRQRDDVDISCLRPSLVGVLKKIEQRYGEPVIITSGYRSREHNQRVHGAKNSLHMYCAAADIKVPGISKWELAKFLRSMPGRGGVGTYCHTNSVHIDVGPERDWNWRCRRRRS